MRHQALGWGPWIIESIVPGESVLFRANENYWRGRPNIDYLLWEIAPTEIFMAAMRAGEYDVAIQGMPVVHFEEHMLFDPNNYVLLGEPGTGTGFMYMRTGTFVDGMSVPRPDGWHPIQDVNIRRALAHSMPQQLIADTIQNGLAVPAGTVLAPFNARAFITDDVEGFFFDLAHANQILDDAGYTERGADGFRLNLDGQPMVFNFAANDNAFNREAVPTYLQMWRDIGLDVRLDQDDLIEWNTFLENVLLSDNWSDEVHMFISNWSMGWNPAPHGLWAPDNSFNMARHVSDEMISILDDIASEDAFDFDFLRNAYIRWQQYMHDNAVARHMFWGISLMPVNNRVANFSLARGPGHNPVVASSHLWALTAPTPYVNTN
jgi:peptide/nickel transport system substrate-binding protein